MTKDYFKRVSAKTPTRFWINNVTEEQAQLAIDAGAVNCTQNPTYPSKILGNPVLGEEPDILLKKLMEEDADDESVLTKFQLLWVKKICDIFLPVFEESKGREGYVTIQSSPIDESFENIVACAEMYKDIAPNIMVKVPATESGLEAIRYLCEQGYAVLATEVMSVAQAIDVCEIYEDCLKKNSDVKTFAFAHIAGIFDEELSAQVEAQNINVDRDALWQAGIIVAKKIRRIMDDRGYKAEMLSGGARGLHHFTEMVGARSGVTINWQGTADKLLESNGVVIDRFSCAPAPDVIDELLEKVPDFKRAYLRDGLKAEEYEDFAPVRRFRNQFENGWNKALDYIAARRK